MGTDRPEVVDEGKGTPVAPEQDREGLPDIAAIEAALKSQYADRDDTIEEMRRLRFMENDLPGLPSAYEAEIVRTPYAEGIIERLVGTLSPDEMKISVPPWDDTEEAQRRSSLLERWLTAALPVLEEQVDEDVRERFIESMVADGCGCMRVLYAPQMWRGFPKRERKEEPGPYNKRVEDWLRNAALPIHLAWRDPLTIYPSYDELGLAMVLEVDQRPLALVDRARLNMADRFDAWDLDRYQTPNGQRMVKFQQLWTRNTLTYAIEGRVVHHVQHRMRRCPYVYAVGQTASVSDAGKRNMPVLWPVRNLIPYLDRLLSQKATAIRIWAWPTPVLKQTANPIIDPESQGQVPMLRDIEVTPGEPVTLFSDEELTFLVWPGQGPDIDRQVQIVMGLIDQFGLPKPLFGEMGADASGYLANQLITAARQRLKPIVKHAENALTRVLCSVLDIIEDDVRRPLYVWSSEPVRKGRARPQGWLRLAPEDIRGYRQVKVTLNPVLPADEYALSSRTINEVRAGLISKRTGRERLGVQYPEEEEARILVEAFKESPPVQQFLIQEAVKRAGLRLQPPELSAETVTQQMPNMPPALQQALGAKAPAGAPGVGGGANVPAAGAPQPLDVQQLVNQVAGLLAQGIPAEAIVQQLVQVGVPLEVAQQLVAAAAQILAAGGAQGPAGVGGAIPQRPPGAGPNVPGMPPAATEASPNQFAAPGQPVPAPTAGPRVRPSGVASGRAPGAKRTSIEK